MAIKVTHSPRTASPATPQRPARKGNLVTEIAIMVFPTSLGAHFVLPDFIGKITADEGSSGDNHYKKSWFYKGWLICNFLAFTLAFLVLVYQSLFTFVPFPSIESKNLAQLGSNIIGTISMILFGSSIWFSLWGAYDTAVKLSEDLITVATWVVVAGYVGFLVLLSYVWLNKWWSDSKKKEKERLEIEAIMNSHAYKVRQLQNPNYGKKIRQQHAQKWR